MRRFPVSPLLSLQAAVTIVAIAGMALWPPAAGAMLLVPMLHGNAGTLVTLARASGAMRVGTGPLPGSVVVLGNRARIARRIRSWDVLLLAAPAAGCGNVSRFGASA